MNNKKIWTSFVAAVCMLLMVTDTNTSLSGAKDGIHLCLYVVIPSLFPMFVLTIILANTLGNTRSRLLTKMGKLCRMPEGSESLLLIGLLSGYPVGAQCVAEAYHNSQISQNTARRLLGFCSNAGPSFIFGMVGSLFVSKGTVFILWFIHIISAIITASILPTTNDLPCNLLNDNQITISKAVEKSAKSMMFVCAWVVLFRIIIAFIQRWLLILLPSNLSAFVIGILELSNGIHWLNNVTSQGMRFVLSSTFLGFGGICVLLQTTSVTSGLGLGYYFPGKILHAAISFLLSWLLQYFIFPAEGHWSPQWYSLIILSVFIAVVLSLRKNSSNFERNVV